jgi:hypothetical protein
MVATSQAAQVPKQLLSTGGYTMSRKHFQRLAEALKSEKPAANWCANKHAQWQLDVKAIANVCSSFNPNFKRERFLTACGLEESHV